MNAVLVLDAPSLPYPEFPLRVHRNGQWFKSVWNARLKKSVQYYFGSWRDDPKGERALHDPTLGWLARRDAIKSGVDNVRIDRVFEAITLGEVMGRFLAHKLAKTRAGELSPTTLGDYLREIEAFVGFMKPGMPADGLRPEHFSAYMRHLIEDRKLGRHSRKRVRAYVMAFLRFGVSNNWYAMPGTGSEWRGPATDPDSMRQAKARSGEADNSDRVLTGDEIDRLLDRASPQFKAIILLAANCGIGPADIGRIRWNMLDLASGQLRFPRFKTGTMRVGFLWQRTRTALRRVRTLKHNRLAIERNGESALVFVSRGGLPLYRETEVHRTVDVNGTKVTKVVGVKIHKPILCTFGRMVRELGLRGISFYRLRHTFRSLATKARDRESADLMMGHRDSTTSKIYCHGDIEWDRIRRVARIVHRQLWPTVKHSADRISPMTTATAKIDGGGNGKVAVA